MDGDLAVDPRSLGDNSRIEAAMEAAGSRHDILEQHTEPGIWVASATVAGETFQVPVDLIVPKGFAPPGGRRGARLGVYGKLAARVAAGLEASLIDKDPITITALDPDDKRTATINVAGEAALFVAKAHKIHDRVENTKPGRAGDKDAADVVRMMQTAPIADVTATFRDLLAHAVAEPPTQVALGYLGELFGRRGGLGIRMATRALSLALTEQQVQDLCIAYTEALRESLSDGLDG